MKQKPTYEELERRVQQLETDYSQLENKLHQARLFSEKIMTYMTEGLVLTDTRGTVISINQRLSEMLGYLPEEIIGKCWLDLVPADQQSIAKEAEARRAQGHTDRYEIILSHKDGHTFPVVIGAGTRFDKQDGQYIGTMGVVTDIAERKRAEEALRESESKFRAAFEGSHDAITLTTKDGRVVDCNKRTLELYGLESKQDFLKRPADLSPYFQSNGRASSEASRELINRAFQDGGFLQFEWVHQRNTGETFSAEVILTPIRLGEEEVLQANIRDITASKQAEAEREKLQAQLQQAQKMEAIGTLTGGIAHDFNNILAIILGYAEILQEEIPASSPARKSLDEVKTASIRARDIVKQLLAFSRKSKQEKQILDIRPIVKEALQMLRSTIPTSIAFESAFPGKLPSVKVDGTQIHQVLINLCTNAAQSMEGEGLLGVKLEKVSLDKNGIAFDENLTPGDFVKLSVSDTGYGIAADDLNRIFDPYFTTKEVGQGSGLGLSVVLGIVKSHGGGIRVDSEVGIGTTFEIYLPATGEKQATPEAETRQDLPTGSERILFVDDEKMIIKLNQQRLQRLGYTVTTTTDPLQALEMIRNTPHAFDLVITDMTMPSMTGDKLTKEILDIQPDMPIILCTGHSERISEDSAQDIGLAN